MTRRLQRQFLASALVPDGGERLSHCASCSGQSSVPLALMTTPGISKESPPF